MLPLILLFVQTWCDHIILTSWTNI